MSARHCNEREMLQKWLDGRFGTEMTTMTFLRLVLFAYKKVQVGKDQEKHIN